ncbi:MalY/PatB family protein [Brucella tritici]|uniref:cysteine-S-conjugate beta-lyase n=1 Tax=Brucella tritici TaxID=94626 RepID=A0A6L3YMR4_9HYPH|nr:PatB family C-S lyase [Brucella tritici]KAB2684186.1 putative C-S lyase [Brucella tritici]
MSQSAARSASQQVVHNFSRAIDRENLSTLKWEMEIDRLGAPDLLSFGTADLDFRSPPAVIDALHRAVESGHFGYPYRKPSYYDAVKGYLDRRFGWQIEKSWIDSCVAIYPSIFAIISELTQPGDEIIYQPPVHHVFSGIVKANGRVPVANQLINRGGTYEMDFDGLKACITDRTKLLLLCSPHNPVGRVWTRDELEKLAQICAEHGIIVVSDEVYNGMLFPGVEFIPFAAVSEWAATNSYCVMSPSKPFNLTGLKHAVVITPNPELRESFRRGLPRADLMYGGSVLGYAAAEAAFRDCDDWSEALMQHIASNHAYVTDLIQSLLPEVTIPSAEAAYFAWLDLTKLNTPKAVYESLIEKQAKLIVTYGEFMGPGGENHIRINLGTSRTVLEAGMRRLLSVLIPLTGRSFDESASNG